MEIKEGIIVGICGDETKNYIVKKYQKESCGCLNFETHIFEKTTEEDIAKEGIKITRAIDALKLVGLDETYLKKNPLELSTTEQKKIMLAGVLAGNPKIIILDDFEKGLVKNEQKRIKNLLKTLNQKFNKTIIIISNNTNFLKNLCEYFYLISKGEVILEDDKEIFDNDLLYKHIDMPKIREFIEYANSLGHKFDNYEDVKELIKAVYRDTK